MISNQNNLHAMECKCIAATPIVVGALVIVGFSFLLNLFSVAIGLTAFTINNSGDEVLVLGGLLGSAIGIVISMFAAGWLTGYLGQRYCTKRHLGALYGFLAWCLALIVAVCLGNHVHEYVALYGHALSGTTDMVPMANHALPNKVAAMTTEKSIIISSYIIFCLFFLSAFATSLGGHCGMRYTCKKDQ